MTAPLLPWHQKIWTHLRETHCQERLAHALLLVGPRGVGKTIVARSFAQALLCAHPQSPNGIACGECAPCHLFQVGNHPDFLWVQPAADQAENEDSEDTDTVGARKKGSRYIVVDQVRALSEWLTLKSHSGGRKIALLTPADRLNVSAANSLLKSLEEPPGATLLMLATANPSQLPATIRSRCQKLLLPAVPREDALPWLRTRGINNPQAELLLTLATGGPLAAEELARNRILEQRHAAFSEWEEIILRRRSPISVAQSWSAHSAEQLLNFQWSWGVDMIKLMLAPHSTLTNVDLAPRLQILAPQIGLRRIYQYLERLTQAIRLIRGPTNPNLQLLWEDLLLSLRV